MTTIRKAYEQEKLGPEWQIVQWWEASSYIPGNSEFCKYPRFTDHRQEWFSSKEDAEAYSKKEKKAYPERVCNVLSRFVLTSDGGKTGHLLQGKWCLRKTTRFLRIP